jgi:hypothetical protein
MQTCIAPSERWIKVAEPRLRTLLQAVMGTVRMRRIIAALQNKDWRDFFYKSEAFLA